MAGKYGASDLGSDWITVPRKFRGRKPTSSDTELAYITGAEKGLLSRFANANQVGPSNIPSYDDSGFDPDYTPKKMIDKNPSKLKPIGQRAELPSYMKDNPKPGSVYAGAGYRTKPVQPLKNVPDWRKPKPTRPEGWYPGDPSGRQPKPKKPTVAPIIPGKDDDDGTTGNGKQCPGGTEGTWPNCTPIKDDDGNKCAGKSLTCPSDRPKGQGVCDPATGNVDFSSCVEETSPCTYGKNPDGSCKEKPGDGNGGDGPSLNTILKPDQTPMLQTLTNEMDLRNMLTNVLNKNNPLFKQARTRALQAMAGRGIVNSSMAEEAVMTAVMNVAMPIATRVIDDLQRVMAANVNASNAFKMALNEAYYGELLKRIDAANTWNLNKMLESQEWARAMLTAKTGAASAKDKGQFERYMDMLSGKTYGNI